MKEHFHTLQTTPKADYGVRTPEVFDQLATAGLASFFSSGFLRYVVNAPRWADVAFGAGGVLMLPSVVTRIAVGLLMNTRFRARDLIMHSIPWRSNEHVLDVGCGSGILTFASAKHVPSGKVVGIDIWDKHAGGGTPHLFWRNAEAEGVMDRVELQNVNAAEMPYADHHFDVVVSSLAVHHMGRDAQKAVQEMIRVLKPGGYLALFDVQRVIEPLKPLLQQQGISIAHESGGWLRVVIGQKNGYQA